MRAKHTRYQVTLSTLSAIVLLLLFVFGGIYWQQQMNTPADYESIADLYDGIGDQPDYSQNIQLLTAEERVKKMLLRLQKKSRGRRLVLDESLVDKFFSSDLSNQERDAACGVIFNTDPPTTTVSYRNEKRRFSIEVPYNESWGNRLFKISPYEESVYGLTFGPIEGFFEGGCGWVRPYTLQWDNPAQVEDFQPGEVIPGSTDNLFEIKKINGLIVVKEGGGEFCYVPSLTILTPEYSYRISRFCGSESDFAVMEEMVKSLKVIEPVVAESVETVDQAALTAKAAQMVSQLAEKTRGSRIRLGDRSDVDLWKKIVTDDADDDRIVCAMEFNRDSANEYVEYGNNELGISAQLPYNAAWGNEAFSVEYFFETPKLQQVEFGPLAITEEEGCGWKRAFTLKKEDKRSLQEVSAEIVAVEENDLVITQRAGHDMVRYVDNDFCSTPGVVVIGKEFNVRIESPCGRRDDLFTLQRVADTVDFSLL